MFCRVNLQSSTCESTQCTFTEVSRHQSSIQFKVHTSVLTKKTSLCCLTLRSLLPYHTWMAGEWLIANYFKKLHKQRSCMGSYSYHTGFRHTFVNKLNGFCPASCMLGQQHSPISSLAKWSHNFSSIATVCC